MLLSDLPCSLRMEGGNLFSHRAMDFWKDNRTVALVLTGKREDRRHCNSLFLSAQARTPFRFFLNFITSKGGKLKWNLLLSSFSYRILKQEDTKCQVFYEWDLCLSGLITLTYISKENPATSFHGHFYCRSLSLCKEQLMGLWGGWKTSTKVKHGSCWGLLLGLLLKKAEVEGERGAPNPSPSSPIFYQMPLEQLPPNHPPYSPKLTLEWSSKQSTDRVWELQPIWKRNETVVPPLIRDAV